jgi:minor extracellular serine protease Vpr
MSRFALSLAMLFSAALFSVTTLPAHAHTASTAKRYQVIVQLQGPPVATDLNLRVRDSWTRGRLRVDPSLPAARAYARALETYQSQEIKYLASKGIVLTNIRRYHVVINGFAADVSTSGLKRLRLQPNVLHAVQSRSYHRLDEPSLNLVNAQGAWAQLGGEDQSGRGMMIANVDTGIDIHNPCFRDAGMTPPPFGRRGDPTYTNNKVIVARVYPPDNTQDYNAQDTVGHGTFSAAIEACDADTPTPNGGKISGVAPDAYLMSYNVFPNSSAGTSDGQIISAIEDALLDGADVVNMSLGSTGTAPELRFDIETLFVSNASVAGVPIVVSAGNAGPTPESVASPASSPDAIAVGAVSNSRSVFSSVHVTGAGVPAALSRIKAQEGTRPFSTPVGPFHVAYAAYGRKPKDDSSDPTANDFTGKDVTGKVALIQRGSPHGGAVFFSTKIANAEAAGAVGVILFDNRSELSFNGDVGGSTLPTMFISQSDGQALLAWIQAHPDTMVTLDPTLTTADTPADVVSDFSSRGYGEKFAIKPDLVAPGQDIYSATESTTQAGELYSPSGFSVADGTSFSAPHVTGAVALVLQKHPTWTPAQVKAALMNTASLDIYSDVDRTRSPSVTDAGAGNLDVSAALSATASLLPASLSFGEMNPPNRLTTKIASLTLQDAGGGAGTWTLAVRALHTDPHLTVSVPASIALSAGGHSDIQVNVVASASTPVGDYDGYIVATRGAQTLHVPYLIHLASQPVKSGAVLLIDNTASLFQPDDPTAPRIARRDVSRYFEQALTATHHNYTYWDEAKNGPPTLENMKSASAVVYFTGQNLNGLAAQNTNPEALLGPVSSADASLMQEYVDAGGRLFVTGMGAAMSGAFDPYFTAATFGAVPSSLSIYDSKANDQKQTGGISPPKPSARPLLGTGNYKSTGIFAGLKTIDLSTRGDGAGDNLAVNNTNLGLVGVPGLSIIRGAIAKGVNAYGRVALKTTDINVADGPPDGNLAAVDSSDEPTFKHRVTYHGRSVLFSFGFEGINSNTGFAMRSQVMARVLQWLFDKPITTVTTKTAVAGKPTRLLATLHGDGTHATVYQWQIGTSTLSAKSGVVTYTFPHRGTYKIRVLITDNIGHVALSPWQQVRVG